MQPTSLAALMEINKQLAILGIDINTIKAEDIGTIEMLCYYLGEIRKHGDKSEKVVKDLAKDFITKNGPQKSVVSPGKTFAVTEYVGAYEYMMMKVLKTLQESKIPFDCCCTFSKENLKKSVDEDTYNKVMKKLESATIPITYKKLGWKKEE